MIVTLPVITGTVNTAVYIVVGSMETLNLTVRIVTRWIFEFVYEHWILTFLFILVLRGLGLKINQSNFIKKS